MWCLERVCYLADLTRIGQKIRCMCLFEPGDYFMLEY